MSTATEELEPLWRDLSLTTEEAQTLHIPNSGKEIMKNQGSLCLIGKIWTYKKINTNAAKNTLAMVWSPEKGLETKLLGENLFLFQFFYALDRTRVLDGSPWAFDNHLVALQEFEGRLIPSKMQIHHSLFWIQVHGVPLGLMMRTVATMIGTEIGEFIDVDGGQSEILWGPFLRIRVKIDLYKPLRRGMLLEEEDGTESWVSFRYERLPTFCYCCGLIGHRDGDCGSKMENAETENSEHHAYGYGPWLRAALTKKKSRTEADQNNNRTPSCDNGGEMPEEHPKIKDNISGAASATGNSFGYC